MKIPVSAATVCGAVLALTACGGTGSPSSATTCEPPTTTEPATRTKQPTETALLTGVTVESNACVDRIDFAFKRTGHGAPSYRVSYLPADKALIEDGSGAAIEVKGTAYLVVRLEPAATADISGDGLVRTYTGPRRLPAPENAHAVREIVKSGDFEAVLTWVIGLEGRRPFARDGLGVPRRGRGGLALDQLDPVLIW